jgi:dipeptidyl aminopeptidase/acylaminoacyl peptidase
MGKGWGTVMACAVLCATLWAAPAEATFRGGNGKIAYVSSAEGNLEIMTVNPDGSGRTNLTNNPASDHTPRWSPDGTQIAFLSSRAGNLDIYLMDADGTNQTSLTIDPAQDGIPYWSPDGTKIAFSSTRNGNDGALWVMDADGSNETKLTDMQGGEYSPSWSPDSTKLTFTRTDMANPTADRDNIYTINVDGSDPTLLTWEPTQGFDNTSFWSPDGSKIAWERTDTYASPAAIYKMNPDGTGKQFVYGVSFTPPLRGWAPSVMKILVGGPTTMNGDGTDRRHLAANHNSPPEPNRYYQWSSEIWSPDNHYVAGERRVCHDELPCRPAQVFVLDGDGINLLEIGQGSSPDWQPIPGPQRSDYKNGAKFCEAEREFWGEDFAERYGGGANAFGKCVSGK